MRFKDFLEKVKDPSSSTLLAELNAAIEEFVRAEYSDGEEQRLVGSMGMGEVGALGNLERRMLGSSLWKSAVRTLSGFVSGIRRLIFWVLSETKTRRRGRTSWTTRARAWRSFS